ncbi:MAG: ABC transporter permease [Gammaproteobacteria bacterium]|nr:ABC transporter permease [Gammaproteobacteria bacterium]
MRYARRAALAVLLVWLALALVADVLPLAPNAVDLPGILAAPDAEHWLGRDDLGRAVGARLVQGAQVSLLVSVLVVTLTTCFGTALGLFAGWRGGLVDALLMRVTELFLAFPGILLAIALAGVLGPGLGNVVLALGAVGWVGFARLARAQTLALRDRDHVQVAHALGQPPLVIVLRHVLPLLAGPLIVEASFAAAATVVAEAGLSFLGLGVQPPTPSWGSMLRDGARYLLVAPHLVLVPGLALASLVVALNLLGDALRDRLDPRAVRLH